MSDSAFIELHNKQKNYNLLNPIISVMARHLYDSSNILKVLTSNEEKLEEKEKLDDNLEIEINNIGARLLEKIIDINELKKILKAVK